MATFFPRTMSRGARTARVAGLTPTQQRVLRSARGVANLMDNQFSFLGFRFGVDTIVGIIPVFGDLVAAGASVYLLAAARQLGVPRSSLARMSVITVADLLLGLVPFLGDAADAVFKSHMRNLRIIEAHVRAVDPRAARP